MLTILRLIHSISLPLQYPSTGPTIASLLAPIIWLPRGVQWTLLSQRVRGPSTAGSNGHLFSTGYPSPASALAAQVLSPGWDPGLLHPSLSLCLCTELHHSPISGRSVTRPSLFWDCQNSQEPMNHSSPRHVAACSREPTCTSRVILRKLSSSCVVFSLVFGKLVDYSKCHQGHTCNRGQGPTSCHNEKLLIMKKT